MKVTIASIGSRYPRGSSLFLAALALWIDIVTGRDVQFPLVYVLPVALAAWRGERLFASLLGVVLPLLRIGFEIPWEAEPSMAVAGLNVLMEIAAMWLYIVLIGAIRARTTGLQAAVRTRESEVAQLRAYVRMSSATLKGRGLSPGMADGRAWLHLPPESEWTTRSDPIPAGEVRREVARLDGALAVAGRDLEQVQRHSQRELAPEESGLLGVQLAMLNDVDFWEVCRRRVVDEMICAESAVAQEIRGMAEMLEGSTNEVMRQRGADIRDVGRRVLRHLVSTSDCAANPLASLPENTIVIARELLPSDMLQIDHRHLAGLVTEDNSPSSHVAILARSRNIPAVSDVRDVTLLLETGDQLLVDAEAGTVVVAPTRAQSELFAERRMRHTGHSPVAPDEKAAESRTRDGVPIVLYANICRPDEARLVAEYGLDGVGLFRSEFQFLDVSQPPAVEEQIAAYSAVAAEVRPLPVVFRTMDFGGDKVPQFHSPETDLAFRAGKRGLAFSLSEETMLRTQLLALARSAPAGEVRVMFPMVTGVADLAAARKLLGEVLADAGLGDRLPVGAMIETPAAVIKIHEIVRMVDFVSIGTNDLAQFILATDRRAHDASGVAGFLHPSVLRATEHVVQTAIRQGTAISVCGEAAADPAGVCVLLGMGVRSLSINPLRAPRLRNFLRQTTVAQMEAVARDALAAATPDEVEQIVVGAVRGAPG
ncbi:phosphoenolpyruvate--protein phosphotransferase [Accumulibacter sp.]|uniref:phosphoenolpyruvate--protein phosphotransferase n=1 Tax=Accumulibacter sp. TaxID=2053492 RepID=UPI0025EB8C72|nr:phosphoenolpyruvate--protein phosphotransferase [Accumulibacter sp.]MCM8594081.1 phosphoenolpyruvate--protein phosphotransferase [Accumulibacter sp.]MCM8624490.1 phosphoenolpyruvate--protein phosphotransferase [Accumulibacter sp.]MDS4048225.1 phosphoenolpyruvate--protein phosphotransferase [Accumulibacter sp.]